MSDESAPKTNRSRRRPLFMAVTVWCSFLFALLVGLPLAEWLTRQNVMAEYRREVEQYNTTQPNRYSVYTFNGYEAHADDPIEYRLRPDHTRTIPIASGEWKRNEQISYLSDAWNLVDRFGAEPRGFLRWVCEADSNETWYAIYSESPEDLGSTTNLSVEALPDSTRARSKTIEQLHALGSGGQWLYAPGHSTDGVGKPQWIYRKTHGSVPQRDSTWTYRINELGFRATRTPLSSEGKRVLFLGDSCLFGWGVHDHETLTARIEPLLGSKVNCINAGVPGYGTEQEFHCLTENFQQFQPDAVVVCQVRNDLEPQMVVPAQPQRVFRHAPLNSWFLERSKSRFGLQSCTFTGSSDPAPGWHADGPKKRAGKEAIRKIRDYCQSHDRPLLIVSIPNVAGRDFIPEFNYCANQVNAWAKAMNVPYRNLMPALEDIPHEELRVSKTDGHLNARGTLLLARALVDPVRDLLK